MPTPSEKKKQEIETLKWKIHTKRKEPNTNFHSPEEGQWKPWTIPKIWLWKVKSGSKQNVEERSVHAES